MKPERHEQIADLFYRALEIAPDQRTTFLETECAGDPMLRDEVDSLLALEEPARDFIETPVMMMVADLLNEESTPLPTGSRIGFYHVLSSLGAGGMGEVYLAEDTRLGRKIALKLLPARFTEVPQRLSRFEQEARTASALNHPNIITIHDIGEVEGRPFIATEFIDGQTLRQRINREPMTLEQTLDVAIQAGNALAAAHEAGVVHRDIKPENIMLRTDGYVKVLDFGLAKLTQESEPDLEKDAASAAAPLTTTSLVAGTVRYMSPEQALGQAVDARSDIFSMGIVLYEMITGQAPFAGENDADVIAAILGHVPSIHHRLTEAPEKLREIVDRALRKDRAERYQTTREMVADLKALKADVETHRPAVRQRSGSESPHRGARRYGWRAFSAAAIVLLAVASAFYYARPGRPIDSIAVLPFVNESNDPKNEYLSDGISDMMISRLYRQFPKLRVMSLSATVPYKGKPLDVQAVGRDLNVRAVLAGRMNVHGDAISVRADLVDTRDNHLLWQGEYDDGRLSQLLQLQDRIWRDASAQLRQLSGEQKGLPIQQETENNEAYRLYVQGRFAWDQVAEEGLRRSIKFFEQAVKEDQNYGLAYSGMADAYSLLGEISAMRPEEAFSNARRHADTALRLDSSLAEAWVSRGIVKLFYDWDWKGAEDALNRAKDLNPNNPHVYHFYGHYLQFMGRTEEAIPVTKQGLRLAHTGLLMNAELGWAYYTARQFSSAIEQEGKTLALDPNFAFASWAMAQAYEQQGKYREALEELNKARAASMNWSWIVADMGYVYAKQGRRTEAEKIIRDLQDRANAEYIDPVLFAYINIALNNRDEAFAWLEKGYQEHAGLIPWLKVEPKFDDIKGDPRFADLMRKVGLPF